MKVGKNSLEQFLPFKNESDQIKDKVKHIARIREIRNACSILVEKTEGTITLGRPRCRWAILLKWILKDKNH